MFVQIDQVFVVCVWEVGVELLLFQSNYEGVLVDCIQVVWEEQIDFILINLVVYMYMSVVIWDVIVGVGILFVEVYLLNVYCCEVFRYYFYFFDQVEGVICGFGWKGYLYVFEYVLDKL